MGAPDYPPLHLHIISLALPCCSNEFFLYSTRVVRFSKLAVVISQVRRRRIRKRVSGMIQTSLKVGNFLNRATPF